MLKLLSPEYVLNWSLKKESVFPDDVSSLPTFRLMQQSVESVWNMAFDFILDNVQVVLQQTYGSTLKVT